MRAVVAQVLLKFRQELLREPGRVVPLEEVFDDLALPENMPFGLADVPFHHFQLSFTDAHTVSYPFPMPLDSRVFACVSPSVEFQRAGNLTSRTALAVFANRSYECFKASRLAVTSWASQSVLRAVSRRIVDL